MASRLEHITIGAFLHDIGKVMQRAELETTPETESLMSQSGPSRDGHSSHYHVKWTNQFFEDYFHDTQIEDSKNFDSNMIELKNESY